MTNSAIVIGPLVQFWIGWQHLDYDWYTAITTQIHCTVVYTHSVANSVLVLVE